MNRLLPDGRPVVTRAMIEAGLRDLGLGPGAAEAWGCDLSAEYVRINAEYTT